MTNNMTTQILMRTEERMKKLGLSERAVGMQALGKPDIVRGWRIKEALPRIDTLIAVARVLQTTPEWLAFGTGSEESQSVPLISWVSAGAFGESDAVFETDDFPRIEIANLPEGNWVALKVEGDSMDRVSPPSSIILVNRLEKKLVPNACYVIQNNDGAATYKRYRANPNRFEPVSTNPSHEPLFPDGNNIPRIFGRVRKSILEM